MQRLLLLCPAQSSGNNIIYNWRQNQTIHTSSVNCIEYCFTQLLSCRNGDSRWPAELWIQTWPWLYAFIDWRIF